MTVPLVNLSRREMLGVSGTLILGATLPSTRASPNPSAPTGIHHLYVSLASDGAVTVTAHRAEMGQGIRTALAQVIADEMDADWEKVSVVQAPGHPSYGNQDTDGSRSIRLFYDTFRKAGATVREMLVRAAADQWMEPASRLRTSRHRVVHPSTGRELAYGDLSSAAAELGVPQSPKLKVRGKRTLIGKAVSHVDAADMASGRAVYGADVTRPNMAVAVVVRPPSRATQAVGSVLRDEHRLPGFVALETIKSKTGPPRMRPFGGVAVVAEDTASALKMAQRTEVEWEPSYFSNHSSETTNPIVKKLLQKGPLIVASVGDPVSVIKASERVVESEYYTPLLSHAPMEPPAALAEVAESGATVWAPVQDSQGTREEVANYLDVNPDAVTVNQTLLGGAFGRKAAPDFVLEAVELSKRFKRPIRVQWTREDDIQYDYYHANSGQLYRASLDSEGRPTAWIQRTVFPTIASTFATRATPQDWELAMGFTNTPYRFENQALNIAGMRPSVRIGWMRSVCNVFHSFGVNSFVDELAEHAGMDPIDYRLSLWPESGLLKPFRMQPDPGHELDYARLRHVVDRVREMSDWDKARAEGRALGFAVHHSFYSYVATVIEVDGDQASPSAKRAWMAVDCGTYINPDTCRAQMEGSVVFGLSIAMYGNITYQNGAVQQSNFDTYPVVRMPECPAVEVHLVETDAPPAGIGEPGVPPVPPAYCNAIHAATGVRHRGLPVA